MTKLGEMYQHIQTRLGHNIIILSDRTTNQTSLIVEGCVMATADTPEQAIEKCYAAINLPEVAHDSE
jgi:hypothetical protein